MNGRILTVLLGLMLSVFASAAVSNPITYTETINTSSISGTTGSFYFQFNPGPSVAQSASLQIMNFLSDGAPVGSPVITGDVSGALPATITFDNGTGFNDYFQGFTFGSTLSFLISLSGPALTSPDGVSTSGSTFAFSMFSDVAGTKPTLTSDTINGFADVITVNLDGSTTRTSYLPVNPVPEPSTLLLLIPALVILWSRTCLRQRQTDSEGARALAHL